MTNGYRKEKIDEFCYVTDYVANGSFAALKENVQYQDGDGFAILVRLADFTRGWVAPFKYVSEHAYKFLSKSALEVGDLVMSNVGEPGKVFRVPDLSYPMTLGPNAILIRPDPSVASRGYLYYYFSSPIGRSQIEHLSEGVAQKKFNKTAFRRLEIVLPPLDEQKRVVTRLDRVFEILGAVSRNTRKEIGTMPSVLSSCVSSFLSNRRWERATLSEVCDGFQYGSSAKSKPSGKVPVLRMGNIQKGLVDWTSLVYTSDQAEIDKYVLRRNDVLFNRTNSSELVGKTAIYKGENPAIFAGYLIRVTAKSDVLDADYLNYYLNSEMAFEYGRSVMSKSVHQANINATKLKDYPIPIPPLPEQERLVKKLDAMTGEIDEFQSVQSKKLNKLSATRQSLLHAAFSEYL